MREKNVDLKNFSWIEEINSKHMPERKCYFIRLHEVSGFMFLYSEKQ